MIESIKMEEMHSMKHTYAVQTVLLFSISENGIGRLPNEKYRGHVQFNLFILYLLPYSYRL